MVKFVVVNDELILDGQRLPVLTAEVAEQIEKDHSNVTSLSLNLLKLKQIDRWPKLHNCRSLSLRDNHLSLAAVPLAELGVAMPALRVISVGGNKLHHNAKEFAAALKPLTTLEVIDLSDLSDKDSRALATCCFAAASEKLRIVAGITRDGRVVESDEEDDDDDDDDDDDEEEEDEEDEGQRGSALRGLMGDESLSSDSEDFAPGPPGSSDDEEDEIEDVDDDEEEGDGEAADFQPAAASSSSSNNKRPPGHDMGDSNSDGAADETADPGETAGKKKRAKEP